MQIRIIKRLPAPIMDGFDVRRFQAVDGIYSVDLLMARYLVAAEYAVCLDRDVVAFPDRRCDGCGGPLTLPEKAAGFAIPSRAEYVCMRCRRAYRLDGDLSQLRLVEFD